MPRLKKTGPVRPISVAKKQRKLYKIAQIMKMLGITGRTIRYYDQLGLLPHVKRSDGGVRLFDDSDIELIKKIRKLQHESELPLVDIKDVIFIKDAKDAALKSIVLTDAFAALPSELKKDSHIEVLATKNGKATTSAPTAAEFEEKFKSLAKKGYKRVYAILSSSTLSKAVSNAQQARSKVAKTIEVEIIDSKSTGAGLGLFVASLAESLRNKETSAEIELLLEKLLPMIHDLIAVNSVQYLTPGAKASSQSEAAASNNLTEKIFAFKPVLCLKNRTGELEIIQVCNTKADTLKLILGMLEAEIASRGGYVNKIFIHHVGMPSESAELLKAVKQRYSCPAYLVECGSSFAGFFGPETFGVGII